MHHSVPFRALSGLAVLQVSCGSRHTLAVVEGGVAYSWGWGACGQVCVLCAHGRGEEGSRSAGEALSVCHYCLVAFGHLPFAAHLASFGDGMPVLSCCSVRDNAPIRYDKTPRHPPTIIRALSTTLRDKQARQMRESALEQEVQRGLGHGNLQPKPTKPIINERQHAPNESRTPLGREIFRKDPFRITTEPPLPFFTPRFSFCEKVEGGEGWGADPSLPRSKQGQHVKVILSLSRLLPHRSLHVARITTTTTIIFVVDVDVRPNKRACGVNDTKKQKNKSWATGMTTGWDLRRK